MDIGHAIRILRQKQGMSQTLLAEKCGMSANAISSLENGKSYPPKGTLERICTVLGVSPSYFLLASIDEGDIPEEKRVLYNAMIVPLVQELGSNKVKNI